MSSQRPERQEGETLSREFVLHRVLPTLPDSVLHGLGQRLGVTPRGFRPGRAPLERVVKAIVQLAEREAEAFLDVRDEILRCTDEVGRAIKGTSLSTLGAGLPGLFGRFRPEWVTAWLLVDKRKGAARLAREALASLPAPGSRPAAPASPAATPALSPAAPSSSAAATETRRTDKGGPSEIRRLERELKAERAAKEKVLAREARLRRLLEKMRQERDRANDQAGATGRQVGELKKQLRRLEEERDRLRAAQPAKAVPVVETAAVREWEERLEAARRETERVRDELAQTSRKLQRNEVLLRTREEEADKLRQALRHSPPGALTDCGLEMVLPFVYDGPAGRFILRPGFDLSVPAQVVRKLQLGDGDPVKLTVFPNGKVTLEPLAPVPREMVWGYVTRVEVGREAARTASEAGWSPPGEAWRFDRAAGEPAGWVGRTEAAYLGLEDGDPVAVLVPRGERGKGYPLRSPAPGLPALPTVKVVRKDAAGGTASAAAGAAAGTAAGTGRARRESRPARKAVLRRRGAPGTLGDGRLRPSRVLAGRKVLVVGGDSFRDQYRAVVEALGGEFEFQGAGAAVAMAEDRARAADVVVLMTAYLSHKVSDRVTDTLAKMGREPLRVNSTGRTSLLKALVSAGREAAGAGSRRTQEAG